MPTGWPVDAEPETIVAGTTTAKKTWADTVVLAVNGLYGGTSRARSIMRALIDGVGGADASGMPAGQLRLAMPAFPPGNDGVADQQFSVAPTTRKLRQEFYLSSTPPLWSRVYNGSGLEIVFNATWNPTGTSANKWTQDQAALPSVYAVWNLLGRWELSYKAAGAAAWTTWSGPAFQMDGSSSGLLSGVFGALQASTKISSATVGSGQAQTLGFAYKDALTVAWGRVHIDGVPSCVVDRSLNIASVVRAGTGLYDVTLQDATGLTTLAPTVTIVDDSPGLIGVKLTGIAAGSFRVLTFNSSATPTDYGFSFEVKGG